MKNIFSFENYDKNKIKQKYDDFYKTKDFKNFQMSEKYFIKSLIEKFNIKVGTRIIDIGCGTGKYTHFLTEFGMDVIGVDISKQGIYVAKKRFPKSKFLVGDVTNLNFKVNSFEIIYCSGLSLFNEKNLDNLLPFVSFLLSFLKRNGLFIFLKTTSLADRFSKNNTRFDYSLESYLNFFKKLKELVLSCASATYPQIFLVLKGLGFSGFITKVSVLNTKLTGIPLRVCIILRKDK